MVIILALLPLKVSLTRSAILAAALLLLAFRQAADFVLVTVLAIAMLWLGEVWKSLFLQSEQQLSELRQQQSPPSAPKIRFSDPGALAFRFATTPDVAKLLGFHAQARCGHTVTPRNRSDNPATSDMTGDEAALDAWGDVVETHEHAGAFQRVVGRSKRLRVMCQSTSLKRTLLGKNWQWSPK